MNGRVYGIFLLIFLAGCNAPKTGYIYASETLKIKQISQHTFIHTSFLMTNDFGKVGCNGMIVVNQGEALVFDTPVNDKDSKELIDWIRKVLIAEPKGIVATHFHYDCLGGLNEFHSQGIPSHANFQTIELAMAKKYPVPQHSFENSLELKLGEFIIENEFLGAGHTEDNIICYFPLDQVLFGGCLIKSMGAGKGNLEDANTDEWSRTISRIKEKFPDVVTIIPGHGISGGPELLEYTKELFLKE